MAASETTAFSKITWLPRQKVSREVFFVAIAYLVYSQVRGLAGGQTISAFANAYHIINIEEKLGIFKELAVQNYVVSRGALIDVFNIFYFYGHLPLLLPLAAWLYIKRPRVYRLARNAFLASGAIAVCFYLILPTAPPRLIGMGFLDTLGTALTPTYSSLPGVNHYAALPSMHVGWHF